MAQSPAHRLGQIIGDLFEASVESLMRDFALKHALYLDKKGSRSARKGKKVTWRDALGNSHDLDYVLEKGGSDAEIGQPVAFIETAWRRYTKHSRNKAQEIQGAILPLVTTHRNVAPFIGTALAGVFTEGALNQLQSSGFSVVYFPYDTIVQAFASVGLDVHFDEETSESELSAKVQAWESLDPARHTQVAIALIERNRVAIQQFMDGLERAISRTIDLVIILPLHGTPAQWDTVDDALTYIGRYDEDAPTGRVARYEVTILYTDGSKIEGQFTDKISAADFLRSYQPPHLQPA